MKTLRTARPSLLRGFSLAELMVVIVIIGLLATLVVPNVLSRLTTGQVGKAKADIVAIEGAINEYAIRNMGRYPESLEALITPDESGLAYLDRESIPKDPWGVEYQYEPPGPGTVKFRVLSYGADGEPGGEGKDRDIDNVMIKEGEI
jgi:general secretion pathway protein G